MSGFCFEIQHPLLIKFIVITWSRVFCMCYVCVLKQTREWEWRLTISVFSNALIFSGELKTPAKIARSSANNWGVIIDNSESSCYY